MKHTIPAEYKKYRQPFRTSQVLFHLTTKENLKKIQKLGYLEPRDPSPKYRAGLKGIFLADPRDALYKDVLKHVLAHVKEKNEHLIRLHIQTSNDLYRSTDPERTFQVVSLTPIVCSDIIKIEKLT